MRNKRLAPRSKSSTTAWIRLEGGFAMRACKVVDISNSGVQIQIDAAESVPNEFKFLASRTAGTGRRARIKWRRGSLIGAEFL